MGYKLAQSWLINMTRRFNKKSLIVGMFISMISVSLVYFYLFVSAGLGMNIVSLKYSNVINNALQEIEPTHNMRVANWPGQGCSQMFLEDCAGIIFPKEIVGKTFLEVVTKAVKNPCSYLVDPESDISKLKGIYYKWGSHPNNASNWRGFKCREGGGGYEEWKVVLNAVDSNKRIIWRITII
jgi:hypothetical protein